jgi:predicted ATPase
VENGQIRTPDQRLRVFISSTLGELAEERRAARNSIEQLRLTPIMFELGARPHPPRTLYRSYLAQSDVFVGIYWQRYGWVAPDMDISGLEDEFILSRGLPRLIYVKRPAPDMEPRLIEILKRLEGEDNASYKPFQDATELRDLLLDDLAVLLTERFGSSRMIRSPGLPHSNLPAVTSTFLGREAALHTLSDLLDEPDVRLVTLTGPGGTGKTRLAIEAARAHFNRFEDGVFFVDLSAARQPDEVFTSIARSLGIGGDTEGSPLDAVKLGLRDRHVLLVLDNFEQVVSAAAGVALLLVECPFLNVLVTSRQTLRVNAERVFPVSPLTVPANGATATTVDAVLRSEAGRLFAQRAAAAAAFVLTESNAADVAAICRRLDGLPLAIELAAARLNVFAVDELRAELEKRHDLLSRGARDVPERQRTLRNTIEWSYDQLADDEQIVFALFSVFTDARLADVEATLVSVPAVSGTDVVETLTSLIDKSLVRVIEGRDGRPRFSMLHTIREYASEQLNTNPEMVETIRQAHAAHYTNVALGVHRRLASADRIGGIEALGSDLVNLRDAWDHLVWRADINQLRDLLGPLWGYHDARGDYRGATSLAEDFLRVLAKLPDTPERRSDEFAVRTNLARTHLAVHGFTPQAEQTMREALDRVDKGVGERKRFPALRSLASLLLMRSEFERAGEIARDLTTIAENEADPALLSETHLLSGLRCLWLDNVSAAIEHADKATAHFDATTSGFVEFRVGPNPGVLAKAVASMFRWIAGFPDSAVVLMEEAVRLARELDHPPSIAFALHHANVVDLWRLDAAPVTRRSDELFRLADDHDYPIWQALALVFRGAAIAQSGNADEGLAEVERGFALYRELSTPPIFWPAVLLIRATTYLAAGQVERARELVHESEANVQANDPLEADIALAHGDILLALPIPESSAAEAHFEHAIATASRRGARMIEIQALSRLATLRQDRAKHDTIQRLRELYDTFTEGLDSPQLQAAKALLGQVTDG